MGWIKKSNVIALAAASGLLALFFLFFFDSLLKRALIAAAQAAVRARVEIASVETHLFKGTLLLKDFTAANKDEPMKNLFELQEARFVFKPSAALRGKVVVSDASLLGLRFGTARKTDGTLPASKPSALELMARKALAPQAETALSHLSDAKASFKADLDPKNLKSLSGLDEAQKKADSMKTRWQGRLDAFKGMDKEIKDIQASLQDLSKGGNSPADFARKAQAVQQAQAKLKGMQKQMEDTRKDLAGDMAEIQNAMKKAEELKKQDLKGLMAAAGLPSLDAESLTKRLLGPAMAAKVSKTLYWISLAKKKSSGSPAKKAEERTRRKGVDVEFPTPGADPQFLLEHAAISGTVASLLQGKDMDLQGTLTGVTSNAPLYGKPARLELGGTVKGGPTLSLKGVLDQTKGQGVGALDFDYTGMPLSGMVLGDGELGASVTAGSAKLKGRIATQGEEWKGEILVTASSLSLEPKLGLQGDMARYAGSALKGVRSLNAKIGLSGKEDDLRFTIDSDLGKTLADGLKAGISAQFAEQRKALEAKLNALYAPKLQGLQGQTGQLQSQLQGPLNDQQQLIEKALKDAAGKSLGGNPLDKLKGLFR